MPSADSQILQMIYDEVKGTRKEMTEVLQRVSVTEQEVKDHKGDKSIHQTPPCPLAERADRRIWGALVTSVVALLGVVGKFIYAKVFS